MSSNKKKKEVQENLVKEEREETEQVTEEEILSILRMVAPGTNLRSALDGALRIGKGGLIVIENDRLLPLIDGGFRINCRFTPQRMMELTKMDGAIVLSKDMKRINYANVLLTPSSQIHTSETGTRHKAAERTAKQIRGLTIAISERRDEVTLYYKNVRYPLKESSEVLRKANEHIQLLESQRELFDQAIQKLDRTEIQSYYNLSLAISAIQKGLLIQKIAEDLKKYVIELGKEGTLIKIRLSEIKGGVERETDLIIKDYTNLDLKKSKLLLNNLSYEEILEEDNIYSTLAYETHSRSKPIKGWRLLARTPLHEADIAEVVKYTKGIDKVLNPDKETFAFALEEEKAKVLRSEIEKMKAVIR